MGDGVNGSLWRYVWNVTAWALPVGIAICVVEGRSIVYALIGALFFAALGAIVWLAGFICRRYGGDLGRKLTRPLGAGGQVAEFQQRSPSTVVVHQPRD